MSGLGLGATLSKRSTGGGGPLSGAVLQLDAASTQSATSGVWKDLKALADFNVTSATLSNSGTQSAYYTLAGSGYFRPSSGPAILQDLHKTTASNAWTLVLTGKTGTVNDDWICGTIPGTGPQNGIGIRWQSDTDIEIVQYTGGATVSVTPVSIPVSTTFILIISYDVDTDKLRAWVNSYHGTEVTAGWSANTNAADGTFTLGGLTDGGQLTGGFELYGFAALDSFCTPSAAADIIDHYNNAHPRTYVREMTAIFVGQSNMSKLFTAYSGAGNTEFIAEAGNYYSSVKTINGAKDGAAVHYDAASTPGAYLNSSNDDKGEVYTDNLEAAMTTAMLSNSKVDVIYVMIGERDSVVLEAEHDAPGTGITEAEHKAAYEVLVNLLKTDFPKADIIQVPIMADTNSNDYTGWGYARRAQYEIRTENTWLKESPAMYDLPFNDDLHLTQAGYETMAGRLARLKAGYDGIISMTGLLGPRAVSATFDPDNDHWEITIEHDAGTDFTVSEYRGQNADVNGVRIAGAGGETSRISATVYRVGTATNLAPGDTVDVTFPWGTLKSFNSSNVPIDNASNPLPLRPFFHLDADEV